VLRTKADCFSLENQCCWIAPERAWRPTGSSKPKRKRAHFSPLLYY